MKRYLIFITTLLLFVFTGYLNAQQFIQQGDKLVGNDAVGTSLLGSSVAISADGNAAIIGGLGDNSNRGAAWSFIRQNGVWSQLGNKLVGTGTVGISSQGISVAISSDGNTAIVGGASDNIYFGAVWIFTKVNGVWTQQGSKLVGSGAVGSQVYQGISADLSSDGNTAIEGGRYDDDAGAAWVFTRVNGVWTQQGSKLVGTDAVGNASQGSSVALSSDGNTAIVGAENDNNYTGAAWIFTRQNGIWSQQRKLVGFDAGSRSQLGRSVSISSDGNTAIAGGPGDNGRIGAAWIFTRQNGVWTQQGSKLVGTGNIGTSFQGYSVSISSDGNTAIIGGNGDDANKGAAWIFRRQNGVWSQLGSKLVGSGAVGSYYYQGNSVALSSDGNTAIMGGMYDNSSKGAAWIFIRTSPHIISATAADGGTISPSGDVTVNYGAAQAFTITPNTGYHTSGVTVDGQAVTDSLTSYTFKNVKENHTIYVTFTQDALPGAPVPVISYPTGGTTVYTTAPIVTWYITSYYPGARYHLQVSEQADFSTITFEKDNISAIQQEVTGLSGGKTYYVRVRLKTPQGQYGYYSSVQSFKVQAQSGTQPAVPIFSYPTNGTVVYTSSPTVSWYITQLSPPVKYQLQMSTTNDFTSPVLDVTNIAGITYQLTNLTGGATYYLRVRSFTSTGIYSAYSQVVSFTVSSTSGTKAVIPVISYPTGGVTVYTTSPYITWYITSYQPTQKYNLQLSTKQDFSTFVINQDNIAALQYQVTGLTPGMTYYARARGKAQDGSYSLFSSIAQFTVAVGSYSAGGLNNNLLGAEKDNVIPKNYNLSQNYPNPFNPVTAIVFSLPKDEMVKVIIYNILGKEVKMLLNEELAAGTYSLTFSADEFPSGVYFYRLSTPSMSMIKKMILEK